MTYLDLINGVLKRLRETTVTTANESAYSSLIGEFVNDAKKQVEQSHRWTALRTSITFPTVVDQTVYSLSNAKQNAVFEQAMNEATDRYLNIRPLSYFNEKTVLSVVTSGSPTEFMFDGTDTSNNLRVRLYPTPNVIETLRFDMVIPQADLTADGTNMTIPSNPVLQMAYGMALRERGETGGQSAAEQFAVANAALNDAIAIDANRYESELVYYRV